MKSSRHHYLPQYYIRGFTSSDGLLYIYDKAKDRILSNKRPPKSIFFEEDRNTVSNGIEKRSVIEEEIYGLTDRYCAPAFKYYTEQPNVKGIHNTDYLGKLKIFAVNLYWRLPVNDSIFDEYWDFIKDNFSEEEKHLFRNIIDDETKKKFYRSNLDNQSLKAAAKTSNTNLYEKVFEFHNTKLVVSDNPVVYRVEPKTLDQIVFSDMAFAISSSRLFFEMGQPGIISDDRIAYCYNAIAIEQAAKYVCASDEDILKESIGIYKDAKGRKSFSILREWLFKATYVPTE